MAFDISVELTSDMIVARMTGARIQPRDLQAARQQFGQVTEMCVNKGISRVMLVSELEGTFSYPAAFSLLSNAESYGWQASFRVALVDADMNAEEANKFAEDVAFNRGLQMRFFREEEAGRKWLRQ